VFAVFASVTIVAYGVLPASEIAQLRQLLQAGMIGTASPASCSPAVILLANGFTDLVVAALNRN
jgi:hypothetical protein